MVTKTFICDICKNSVGETELCEVEVIIKKPQDRYTKMVTCKKDICKGCLKKKGIITELTGKREEDIKNDTANQKTFESKLIEILEDLGVQFVE